MKFIVFTVLTFLFAEYDCNHRFTPLDTDNHPCKAENLKMTNRYICSSKGDVFCQTGWEEPSDPSEIDPLNPCPMPICDVHGETCHYGVCEAPDYCACEIGWEGAICDVCIPLPGCQNGNCTEAMECNCRDGWTGGFCEIPLCRNCQNGECAGPEECVCFSGWEGDACDTCLALPGCKNGQCGDHPNTCKCDDGWEGHLCDEPICNDGFGCGDHGTCFKHPNDNSENFCVCKTGWQGDSCDRCVPYWECPQPDNGIPACINPNDCICTTSGLTDPKGLCGHSELGGEN